MGVSISLDGEAHAAPIYGDGIVHVEGGLHTATERGVADVSCAAVLMLAVCVLTVQRLLLGFC